MVNVARPNQPINVKQLYNHPTVDLYVEFLISESSQCHRDEGDDSDGEEVKESWLAMDRLYKAMTARMDDESGSCRRSRHSRHLNGWIRSSPDFGPIVLPDDGLGAYL